LSLQMEKPPVHLLNDRILEGDLFMKKDYTGYTLLIYSPGGEYLGEGTVSGHDKKMQWIELRRGLPQSLKVDDICPLLFLTSPSPYEYQGRVVRSAGSLQFALFKGKEKESRKMARYKVNFPTAIEALVIDGDVFPLFSSEAITVINISRKGIRFSAPPNTLLVGDKFTMRMRVDGNDRLFTAIVVNLINKTEVSEYGCRLVGNKEGA